MSSTRYKNPILKRNAPSLTPGFSIQNKNYQNNVFKDNNYTSLQQLNTYGGLDDIDAENIINEDEFNMNNIGLQGGGSILQKRRSSRINGKNQSFGGGFQWQKNPSNLSGIFNNVAEAGAPPRLKNAGISNIFANMEGFKMGDLSNNVSDVKPLMKRTSNRPIRGAAAISQEKPGLSTNEKLFREAWKNDSNFMVGAGNQQMPFADCCK